MLVEFSVENHRSIRDRQTFLMAAGEDTEHTRPHRAVDTAFPYAPRVLTSACIVGPNGAGKSSLVEAMRIMSSFARSRHPRGDDDDEIRVEPFAFHSEWNDKPSEFEVVFIQNGTLYQYGFALTRSRVVEEWLFVCNENEEEMRKLFSRKYNKTSGKYKWDGSGTQYEDQKEFWQSVTKSNTLFLSVANEFNITEDIENARIWIARRFLAPIIESKIGYPARSTTARRFDKKGWKDKVLSFLNRAGISVSDIVVDRRDDIHARRSVSFSRQNNLNQSIWLDLYSESTGTKDLFILAAPILDALENGSTLVVDELNLGLHPLAFESLIAMFYDPDINRGNAQLIFTTHDLASIEHARIDYDQIWLVDKNDELAAELYPFSDYKTSGKRSFTNGYLHGLYGAIPRVSRIRL